MIIDMLYVYATGERSDGFRFAIGAMYKDSPVNGAYALFTERTDALVYLDAMREKYGIQVHVSPSVAGGPGMIEKGDGSFHPVNAPGN